MYWKLNRIQYPVYNLGPGTRIGIWVQGCSLKCRGCVSPSLWTSQNGKQIDIEYLVKQISAVQDCFDGITISGGEPFDQYQALIVFSAFIKKKTGLNIYSFSGYTLKELTKKFPDQLFMTYLDYLLDGRYMQKKHSNRNDRGSINQNLYKFENKRFFLQKDFFTSKRWSVNVSKDNQVFMSGIPRKNDLNKIKYHFNKLGIEMVYV